MSSSDEDFEIDCESCESSDESDEGEVAEETPGEDANDDDIPAAQHRLLVVRGREPYMFEPMAPQQDDNIEVAEDDDMLPQAIDYDERMGNIDW